MRDSGDEMREGRKRVMPRLNKTFLENGQCYCIFETRQYVFIL